ncbi:MAG: LysR family transcriptional regulator [Gammaproteobacteria bacterium]|nr:LysR family transcriptional regulator [Gammaproteobacteria bacterium]
MIDKKTIPPVSVSLEQWRALAAVVDHGGYAQAAEALGKSQSTVSHSMHRLEERLGTRVLRIQGRKAVLTEVGTVALRRARILLSESAQLERVAQTLAAGIEAEIHLAVDTIFPNQLLLPAVCAFTEVFPDTRVEIIETVISGVRELLHKGEVQMAITPQVPQGWLGERLISLEMHCVAHPDHPLHNLGRSLNQDDLRQHRQIVIRESGEPRNFEGMWLGAEQRLTVSTMGTRIQALCAGLGFAWCPLLKIANELQAGLLEPLPLAEDSSRFANLYLLLADADGAGRATRSMAGLIKSQVENCSESAGV